MYGWSVPCRVAPVLARVIESPIALRIDPSRRPCCLSFHSAHSRVAVASLPSLERGLRLYGGPARRGAAIKVRTTLYLETHRARKEWEMLDRLTSHATKADLLYRIRVQPSPRHDGCLRITLIPRERPIS